MVRNVLRLFIVFIGAVFLRRIVLLALQGLLPYDGLRGPLTVGSSRTGGWRIETRSCLRNLRRDFVVHQDDREW